MIDISICIANYNKWNAIIECLDSIKKYEWNNNIEVVIVDDYSTDNSIKIITEWIKDNPSISVIVEKNDKNSWPWYTYNHAIKLAHWNYVTFMDSDDFFIASTLQEKLKLFKDNSNLKIVYWNGTFYENWELNWSSIHINIFNLFKILNYEPEKILNEIVCKIPMLSVSTSLIKKDFLDEIWWFDDKCFSNDLVLNIKIFQHLKSSNEFSVYDKIAFWYRINDNNISKDYDRILKMLKEVLDKYCPDELRPIWYSNIYFTNALSNLTVWKYKKAVNSMYKSTKYKFSIKKIWFFILSLFIPYKLLNKIPPKKIQLIKSKILKNFQ